MIPQNWIHVIAAMTIGCSTLQAQQPQKPDTPFDPKAALTALYGGETWRDPHLTKYFRSQGSDKPTDLAYISLGFEASYVEEGHPKHLIVSLLTPKPPDSYGCHACQPLMGAGAWKLSDGKWQIESATKIIDFIAPGRHFSLVRAGPARYALLLHQQDDHQGYELNRFDILLPDKGHINHPLSTGFNENPSPGACSDAQKQSVELTFDTVTHGELYDVLTLVKKNEGQCGHVTPIVEHSRYEYVENVYKLTHQ